MSVKPRKSLISTVVLLFTMANLFAQSPILLTDRTLKLSGGAEEVVYFGFTKGDEIIFDFEEIDGKKLGLISVTQLPNKVVFETSKAKRMRKKEFSVSEKSVFEFKFRNTASHTNRTVKFKIQRVPKNRSTSNFNTNWKYQSVFDTTYTSKTVEYLAGYDTTFSTKPKRQVVYERYEEIELLSRTVEIKSRGVIVRDNPTETIKINLPDYQNYADTTTSRKVVAWAFAVEVGEKGSAKIIQALGLVSKAASSFGGIKTKLAAYALDASVQVFNSSASNLASVRYYLTDEANAALFYSSEGKSQINSYVYGRVSQGMDRTDDPKRCRGDYYLCLKNENRYYRINVSVSAVAVVLVQKYGTVY